MKAKGIGRIFIICIIALTALLSVKNLLQKKSASLTSLFSKVGTISKKSHTHSKVSNHLVEKILEQLEAFEVKENEIRTQFFLEYKRREIKAAIPRGRPIEWIVLALYRCAKNTPYTPTDCVYNKRQKSYTITYTSSTSQKETVVLTFSRSSRFMSNSAKIAFLIEGFNFKADQTTIDFLSFPNPLSLLIIPSAKKSGWTAQAADEYNKEIIIHLPLEPQPKNSAIPKESIIMIHYSEEKIRGIISEAIKIIPNFSGFANLQGNLALEDSRVMRIVLHEIKKNHGYFIDLYADKNSVVRSIAEEIRIPFSEAPTHIEETEDVSKIVELLKHYAVVAQKRSKLLVTAKACQPFIKALNTVLPVYKQNGIRLVYVSEIVEHPKKK